MSFSLFLFFSGEVTIDIKTLNCQLGGGVAAIIYNNIAGTMESELSNTSAATIPSLYVAMAEGSQLKSMGLEKNLTIGQQKGYGYLSGTSMAVPYVTGVIAKVWRSVSRIYPNNCSLLYNVISKLTSIQTPQCPICTNQQVERCLLNTTMDLGEPGKDVYYGNGLVQAKPAYQCLKDTEQCC